MASNEPVDDQEPSGYFGSQTHPLLCGMIVGALMSKKIDARPMVVGGDYTNEIVVTFNDSAYLITVEEMESPEKT